MKRNRGIALLLALAMLLTAAAGCGQSGTSQAPVQPAGDSAGDPVQPEAAEEFKLGWVSGDDIYPFHVRLRESIKEFGEKAGITVLVADAKSDVNNECTQIENYVTQGVDVIATAPRDPDGTAVAADACWKAGIPYISVCGEVNTKRIYAGSNDVIAGEIQAEYLAEALPENAKLLYLTTNPVETAYILRKEGLQKLFTLRPDVEILSEQNCKNRADLGMQITENWIQTYDHFDAIVGQNDDCVIGAIQALKAANRMEGVITLGVDGGLEALESIQAGELTATAYQDAYNIGKAVVDVAVRVRDGEDPTQIEDQVVPFQLITRDNVMDVIDLVRVD